MVENGYDRLANRWTNNSESTKLGDIALDASESGTDEDIQFESIQADTEVVVRTQNAYNGLDEES